MSSLAAVEALCHANHSGHALYFAEPASYRQERFGQSAARLFVHLLRPHFSSLIFDPQPLEERPPPFAKTKEMNRITYVHTVILSSSHARAFVHRNRILLPTSARFNNCLSCTWLDGLLLS
jgi:hypothetical protein